MAVLTVNVTNWVVIGIFSVIIALILWHLIRVYRKSPCGDCASAKQCSAFSKNKILKAYKKQCKLEGKNRA
ncbi:MAG: hypothetical protein K2K15_05590 [Anaeroplasmataceae bacterium]|nr:hypothetical protein [Anaeroplasmataceae bacterium]